MSKQAPVTAQRWAVSTRTSGPVLTASVELPGIDLCLLGIPSGFTTPEIQSWLKDLAGVAIETSRSDDRTRPIPQLLHHALTGLLFSQTELWSHTGQALPCAAVFVDSPKGAAFGWVGRARVVMLLNGEPYEPQWVIVRDEAGHEAMSAMLPADSHVLISVDYWPQGEDGRQAPASVEAEHGEYPDDQTAGASAQAPATPAPEAAPVASAEPAPAAAAAAPETAAPVASAAEPALAPEPPAPAALPTDQPGLAPDPTAARLEVPAPSLPSTRHPSESTFAMPVAPGLPATPSGPVSDAALEITPNITPELGADSGAAGKPEEKLPATPPAIWRPSGSSFSGDDSGAGEGEPGHPVGRWLSKLVGFGKKAISRASEPPVSEYDKILSERARAAAAPASAPAPPAITPPPAPVAPEALVAPPAPADPDEPKPLPAAAAKPLPEAPKEVAFGRFKAAGLGDILGAQAPRPSAPVTPIRPVEGLTAVSAASGPIEPPAGTRAPSAPPSGESLYPVIDMPATPPATPPAPFRIEREPVGADAAFGIPKLPPPSTPRPVRVPPVQPVLRRPEDSASSAAPAPPAAAPPEPPADFLAEFARTGLDTPAAAAPPQAPPPPAPAPLAARVAPPPAPTPLAPPPPPAAETPVIVVRRPSEPPPPPPPVLRAPTQNEPVVVSASEMPALMRELKLPTPSAEMARPALPEAAPDAAPDGMLLATPATPMPEGLRARRSWPAPTDLDDAPAPFWRKPWVIGAFVTVLFGIGWLVGHSQAPDNDVHATPMSRVLRTVGLGGARFVANVDTDPPGAWIEVDGKPINRQTPATLELVPGEHTLKLGMPDLGAVEVKLKGSRGQKLKVNEPLHGTLDVRSSDASLPVKVALDGAPQGWLPVHLDHLPPGMHEVQFTGPNMQPWAQTVSVPIRGNAKLVARPMTSPATGQLQITASINDDNGTAPLNGASIYVDGEARGVTPMKLELPRGPHSLRVTFRGETAPIQVIDLPGGNQRFASFQFGLDSDLPPLRLQGNYATISTRRATMVAASLEGLDPAELREAWLHVRTADGLWRRYAMSITSGATGAVMSVAFPLGAFDSNGRATWYLSAATAQGDDFYTEMQRSSR